MTGKARIVAPTPLIATRAAATTIAFGNAAIKHHNSPGWHRIDQCQCSRRDSLLTSRKPPPS
jgi:hypothetical protein